MMVGSKDGASRGTKTLCRRIRALTNITILDYGSFSSVSCLGVLYVCLFISKELFWVRAKRDNYIWAFRELSDAVFGMHRGEAISTGRGKTKGHQTTPARFVLHLCAMRYPILLTLINHI
jgi:hypothetical protein